MSSPSRTPSQPGQYEDAWKQIELEDQKEPKHMADSPTSSLENALGRYMDAEAEKIRCVSEDEFAKLDVEFRSRQEMLEATIAATMGTKIGKHIGKAIGEAFEEVIPKVLETGKATFDVREQILANINFALSCYTGDVDVDWGITVVILGHGDKTAAAVYLNNRPHDNALVLPLVQGPECDSDLEALLELMEKSKTALTLAMTLREGPEGFINLAVLRFP